MQICKCYLTPTQRYFRVQKRGHCRHFRWWWEWVEIGREKIRKLVKSGQAGAFGRVLPPRTASPQIITYWANTPYSLSITRISILTTPLLQPALDITILTSTPLKNLTKQLYTTCKCVCLCFCVCECWGRELWLNSHRVTEEMITRITNLTNQPSFSTRTTNCLWSVTLLQIWEVVHTWKKYLLLSKLFETVTYDFCKFWQCCIVTMFWYVCMQSNPGPRWRRKRTTWTGAHGLSGQRPWRMRSEIRKKTFQLEVELWGKNVNRWTAWFEATTEESELHIDCGLWQMTRLAVCPRFEWCVCASDGFGGTNLELIWKSWPACGIVGAMEPSTTFHHPRPPRYNSDHLQPPWTLFFFLSIAIKFLLIFSLCASLYSYAWNSDIWWSIRDAVIYVLADFVR